MTITVKKSELRTYDANNAVNNILAAKGDTLTGAKMKEIQAVNACRRDAVANGMKLEDAMAKWQTIDQLPAEYQG